MIQGETNTKKLLEEVALELNLPFSKIYDVYNFQNKNIINQLRSKHHNDIIVKYIFKFVKPFKKPKNDNK